MELLFLNPLDIKKIFGSIPSESLWKILCSDRISIKIVNIIKAKCDGFSSIVIVNGIILPLFKVSTLVK